MPDTSQRRSAWRRQSLSTRFLLVLALVALLGLVAIGAVWHARQRNEKPMELIPRDELYGDDRQPSAQA